MFILETKTFLEKVNVLILLRLITLCENAEKVLHMHISFLLPVWTICN